MRGRPHSRAVNSSTSFWTSRNDCGRLNAQCSSKSEGTGRSSFRVRSENTSSERRLRVHRTSRTYRRWRQSYGRVPDPVSVYRLALAAADEQAIVRAGKPTREQFPEQPRYESDWSAKTRAESPVEAGAAHVRVGPLPRPRARTARPRLDRRALLLLGHRVTEMAAAPLHTRSPPRPPRRRRSPPPPRRAGHRVAERPLLLVLGRTPHPPPHRRQEQRTRPPASARPHPEPRTATAPARPDRLRTLPRHHRREPRPAGRLRQALANQRSPSTGSSSASSRSSTRHPEADGSHRRYFLRVPPDVRTARAAVAWTFGFDDERQYDLASRPDGFHCKPVEFVAAGHRLAGLVQQVRRQRRRPSERPATDQAPMLSDPCVGSPPPPGSIPGCVPGGKMA